MTIAAASGGRDRWPIRSMLFVPAHHPDWVSKAIAVGPDAVVLDLEDSVPAAEKPRARSMIATEVAALGAAGVVPFLRPNAASAGGLDDLAACVCPGLGGIVLPKAASAHELRRVADTLSYAEGKAGIPHGEIAIVPIPESAAALYAAHEIAGASARIRGLMTAVGTFSGDVARSFGFQPTMEGEEQLYLQSKIILDSRAAGAVYPIAAIFAPQLDDLPTVEQLVRRARTLGFSGACLIHPSHVSIANRILRPSEDEVARCAELIEAIESAQRKGDGAARYRGAMVDLAVLPHALEVVADAQRRKLGG